MVLLRHLEQSIRPFSWYYNPIAYSSTPAGFFHGLPSSITTTSSSMFYRNSTLKQKSKAEAKEIAAKKHSEAERRRRLRINCQYATLRTILPHIVKLDKASVLGETVRYLNELKKQVKDIEAIAPGIEDSIKLSYCNRDSDKSFVKVVFSCCDRTELISELTESLESAKGNVVRAENVTVGGRTKYVLWVQGVNGNEGMLRLKKALKPVVNGNSSIRNKFRSSQRL